MCVRKKNPLAQDWPDTNFNFKTTGAHRGKPPRPESYQPYWQLGHMRLFRRVFEEERVRASNGPCQIQFQYAIDVGACFEAERVCAGVGLMPKSTSNICEIWPKGKMGCECQALASRQTQFQIKGRYVHWASSCPRSCAAIQIPPARCVQLQTPTPVGQIPSRGCPRRRARTTVPGDVPRSAAPCAQHRGVFFWRVGGGGFTQKDGLSGASHSGHKRALKT